MRPRLLISSACSCVMGVSFAFSRLTASIRRGGKLAIAKAVAHRDEDVDEPEAEEQAEPEEPPD
jgi:hypothetical protein